MPTRIARFSRLVPDCGTAFDAFCRIGFERREDIDLGNGKRRVRIAPPGAETEVLLARASGELQSSSIAEQGGGRVWLFLEADYFAGDCERLQAAGVEFDTLPALLSDHHRPMGGATTSLVGKSGNTSSAIS